MKNSTSNDQDWFIPRENVFSKSGKSVARPRQAIVNFLLAYSNALRIERSNTLGEVEMILN